MDNKPSRYKSFVGYALRNTVGQLEGIITDVQFEDGKWWYTVDDSYQICAKGSIEIIDLIYGSASCHIRLKAI